jgi:alpha-mannosidase
VEWVEQGPVRWTVRVKKTFLGDTKAKRKPTEDYPSSFFTQDISLYSNLPWLETRFAAEWWEEHACVKVEFPLTIDPPVATYEAPYAQIERSTRRDTPWEKARYEVPAQKWADMSLDGFGVSILNESKYGYDALHNVLRLTGFRAPTSPDPAADRGRQWFSYAVYPHAGTWRDGGTVKAAYQFNHPLVATEPADPMWFHSWGLTSFAEQWGGTSFAPFQALGVGRVASTPGGAPDPPEGTTRPLRGKAKEFLVVDEWQRLRQVQPSFVEDSLVSCSVDNVILPVVKRSEKDPRAFIVRCVEWAGVPGTYATLTFKFPIERASLVNLLEERPKPADVKGNTVSFVIGPHAIETLLVTPKR